MKWMSLDVKRHDFTASDSEQPYIATWRGGAMNYGAMSQTSHDHFKKICFRLLRLLQGCLLIFQITSFFARQRDMFLNATWTYGSLASDPQIILRIWPIRRPYTLGLGLTLTLTVYARRSQKNQRQRKNVVICVKIECWNSVCLGQHVGKNY